MFRSYVTAGAVTAALAFGGFASSASAETYSLYNITGNNGGDAAIGEAQLSLEVTFDAGNNCALFTINNTGSEAATVASVYFDDDGSLLVGGSAVITESSGVDFEPGGSPGNLPGGDTVVPPFVSDFNFTAEPPPAGNGVDPSEWVAFCFDFNGSTTFDDVIDALNDGSLRLGLHVISFDSGGSESFITPEPTSLALLGLGGLVALRRRRA